jgi:hypothetical protein
MGITLANLAALGSLIGMVGASRAYSVGLHTLYRDHLPAVVVTLAAMAVVSFALGSRIHSSHDVLVVLGFGVAADVLAALAVTLVFDEMRRDVGFALPRAIFTQTAGGLQLLALGAGATTGYIIGRRRRGTLSPGVIPGA